MNQIKKKTKGLAVMALLLCLCVSAVAQSAMVEGRIVIGNDDSAVVTPVYPGSRLLEDELAIGEKYADEFLASGLLRKGTRICRSGNHPDIGGVLRFLP